MLVSRDGSYERRRRARLALVTSTTLGIPSKRAVGPANGLEHHSVINADELQMTRPSGLIERIGELDADQRPRLDAALHNALGLRP